MHIDYCKGFGISKEAIEKTEESEGRLEHIASNPPLSPPPQKGIKILTQTTIACTAYTRYVLDVGQSQDWIGLQVALAPCLLGYGVIAKQLHGDINSKRDDTNPYWAWIKNYIADDYVSAVRTGSGMDEMPPK